MSSTPEPEYTVDRHPQVVRQIKACLSSLPASDRNAATEVLEAIITRLERDPLQWGDPERRTRKEGGMVCHGILKPFFVQYVVYDIEKVVFILNVKLVAQPPST